LAQAQEGIVCIAPIGNSLRMKTSTSPWTAKKCLEVQLFLKLKFVEGFQGFFKGKSS